MSNQKSVSVVTVDRLFAIGYPGTQNLLPPMDTGKTFMACVTQEDAADLMARQSESGWVDEGYEVVEIVTEKTAIEKAAQELLRVASFAHMAIAIECGNLLPLPENPPEDIHSEPLLVRVLRDLGSVIAKAEGRS